MLGDVELGVVVPGVVALGVVLGVVAPGVVAPGVVAPGVVAPGVVAPGVVVLGVVVLGDSGDCEVLGGTPWGVKFRGAGNVELDPLGKTVPGAVVSGTVGRSTVVRLELFGN